MIYGRFVLLLLFLLVACQPEPEPTPESLLVYELYLPVLSDDCPGQSGKKGLASANANQYRHLLCFEFYHNWQPEYTDDSISTLWSWVKNGYDYLAKWKQIVPSNSEITVYFINEPDRADQANLTKTQTAQVLILAMAHCPGCCFVGPGISSAQDGRWVQEFIVIFEDMGGNLDRICAWSLHMYPNSTGWGPTQRVDVFCSFVPCDRPIWVTEVGWNKCNQTKADHNSYLAWLKELENDERVERYYGYTAISQSCTFSSFVTAAGDLTWVGKAFRDPLSSVAYP